MIAKIKKKSRKLNHVLPVLGWREWVSLPELEVSRIKVKVDTGATTSALHAEEVRYVKKGGKRYVRFLIHPYQGSKFNPVRCLFPYIEKRDVRSSVGTLTRRPVIRTTFWCGGQEYPLEITLVNRDIMGYRMLLGREAIRNRFLVDVAQSYCQGRPKKGKLKRK